MGGGGGGIGGLVSGGANAFVGNTTFGAYTPNGRGWLQGNDPVSALSYGASGGLYDKMGQQQRLDDVLRSIPQVVRPDYPGYKSILDQNNNLPANMQINPNTQGLDKLKAETLAAGASPWAMSQVNQVNANKGNALAANGMQAQSNMRSANRAVSATTGLSAAAQSRMQAQANKAKMLGNQAINRQATQNTQDIMTADAGQKDQSLAALPQLQLQALQPQQTNIQNTLTQKSARDLADLERYKTEMGSWASANTAKAIQNSGGKK